MYFRNKSRHFFTCPLGNNLPQVFIITLQQAVGHYSSTSVSKKESKGSQNLFASQLICNPNQLTGF